MRHTAPAGRSSNLLGLIRRVHSAIGYVPIYVGLVSEDVQPIRMPHYREYRPTQS